MIKLWTLQAPGHQITSGTIDHTRSEYTHEIDGLTEAYQELWRRLETPDGQILWCSAEENGLVKTGLEMVRWELLVPRDHVVRFLDTIIWNRILGIRSTVGPRRRHQWLLQALEEAPEDSKSRYDQIRDAFWEQSPQRDSWWDELFVDGPGENVDAIIPYPVSPEFVVGQQRWVCR